MSVKMLRTFAVGEPGLLRWRVTLWQYRPGNRTLYRVRLVREVEPRWSMQTIGVPDLDLAQSRWDQLCKLVSTVEAPL